MASDVKKPRTAYPLVYEGGSLPLDRSKITATLGSDELIFERSKFRISIPAKDITRISCGNQVRKRLGATVLDSVPLVRPWETEIYYIGLTWNASQNGGSPANAKAEAVLRLTKEDYHEFRAALEQMTGMKAVDTSQVPTVVRYML